MESKMQPAVVHLEDNRDVLNLLRTFFKGRDFKGTWIPSLAGKIEEIGIDFNHHEINSLGKSPETLQGELLNHISNYPYTWFFLDVEATPTLLSSVLIPLIESGTLVDEHIQRIFILSGGLPDTKGGQAIKESNFLLALMERGANAITKPFERYSPDKKPHPLAAAVIRRIAEVDTPEDGAVIAASTQAFKELLQKIAGTEAA